jgi:hypothetical protein
MIVAQKKGMMLPDRQKHEFMYITSSFVTHLWIICVCSMIPSLQLVYLLM